MDKIQNITCPSCSHQFDVEDVLAHKIEKQLKSQFEKEKSQLIEKMAEGQKQLDVERKIFEEKKQKENELFKAKLNKALEEKKVELKSSIKDEYELKIKTQTEELEEKRLQLRQLKEKEIEIEKMKVKMDEMAKDLELQFQKKMGDEIKSKEEVIRKRVSEENELRLKEKDKQLEDQRKLIEEMRRKSQQGSMQLQGEVQEWAIESFLTENFPFDQVEEIKTGARGGDCIQFVNTRTQQDCGKIYYESKRTKEFQPKWIEKFKSDMTKVGADIGVIVTQAYPKGETRMTQRKGIWICSFEEFKSLCHVLRDTVIRVNSEKKSQENKGDKMELLYNYLTSQEFKLHVEGIVEGFTQMHTDLQKEKNAMQRIWANREKQIQKVLENTSTMYGAIQGYAGSTVPQIGAFDLEGLA